MGDLAIVRKRSHIEDFTNGPIYFLSLIGISMKPKEPVVYRIYKRIAFTNSLILYFMQAIFVGLGCGTFAERCAAVTFINYFTSALGKNIVMNNKRLALIKAFEDFKKISPSTDNVRVYKLERYLRNYLAIEKFLYVFYKIILVIYMLMPTLQSFYIQWKNGAFGFVVPVLLWPPIPEKNSYLVYIVYCTMSYMASHFIGFNILGCDLTLLSFLSQLCTHFDLLSKRIGELRPENEDSVQELKNIIKDHQKVLNLAAQVNNIFYASVFFTFCSSSFIMCFLAYQMMDDVSLFIVIKSFSLLLFETKQVVLICYFGNKLMEASSRVFTEIWMQRWYNGSKEYRRLTNFFMMHTRRPIALNIAGIVNVSLVSLKEVFGTAYQVFAVLQTRRDH